MAKTQEEVCWEEWLIDVHVINTRTDQDKETSLKKTEKQLRDIFLAITNKVNTNKDHIPPITTTDATPFPYRIVVPSVESETWGSVFKKMLVES